MNVCKLVVVAIGAVAAGTWSMMSHADPGIAQISAPLQYDANNWYAYAVFSESANWNEADTVVAALPLHNGLIPILATFPTLDQFDWFVNHQTNFSSPSIGTWDIGWLGATNAGGGNYVWAHVGGTIATNAPQWDHLYNPQPQPSPTNYGVAHLLGTYGNVWATYPASEELGNAIVQYVVPEPATVLLMTAGGLLIVGLRRGCRRD